MRVFVAVLVLILNLQSWTKAEEHGLVVDNFHIDRKTKKKLKEVIVVILFMKLEMNIG